MILNLFKSSPVSDIPNRLYGAVVAKARDPHLYGEWGVPDTVMGRFDMLALFVYLFARRMRQQGDPVATSLSQDVFDLLVADVDRALRELGIGDSSVPKKKKRMIRSFYGQIEDFDALLDRQDREGLALAVARRYMNADEKTSGAGMLADYMLAADRALQAADFEQFTRASFEWPYIGQE